jgi:cobalt-zinc-cadmium efflux system protein
VLALFIVYEGIRRLIHPPGAAVLVVALVGIVVNLAATWTLRKANRQSMNIEGAFQHILTDLFASIATAIAGALILLTGFHRADGITSLLIAATMLKDAYVLLVESGRVFLESRASRDRTRPDRTRDGAHRRRDRGARPAHLRGHLRLPGALRPRSGRRTMRLPRRPTKLEALLHDRFALEHTTLQVDHKGGELLQVEPRRNNTSTRSTLTDPRHSAVAGGPVQPRRQRQGRLRSCEDIALASERGVDLVIAGEVVMPSPV